MRNLSSKYFSQFSRLRFVVAGDLVAACLAAPLALMLGHVKVTLGWEVYAYLAAFPVVASVIFIRFRLYSSLWRFASSYDFLNIGAAVSVTTILMYLLQLALSATKVIPVFDGRAFIIYALVLSVLVSLLRLSYRFLSDWTFASVRNQDRAPPKSAIFVGSIPEAALAIRELQSNGGSAPRIGVIIAPNQNDTVGTYLAGIIIRRDLNQLSLLIAQSRSGLIPLTHVIIGRGGFKDAHERIESIRRARASGLNVMTFRGIEDADLDATGRLLREVDVLSMLNREQYEPDEKILAGVVARKRILVTGGAGSIGSQLAQRCLSLGAAQVVIADRSEAGVFHWLKNLPEPLRKNADARVVDISCESGMTRVFRAFNPDVVFHAAALKHVPLVEANWASAITTNILGTWNCAQLAQKFHAERFVFISTDKAVEPTTFLGQTKRFGELICGAMNQNVQADQADGARNTRFTSVRFGNVFGTEGSVVNVFEEQIKAGGALTVTHPEMRRYFMTASEASSLVILSTAIDAQDAATSSRIYVLEMGEQIKIIDIARAMIRLAGKNPDVDVEIKITGIRQFEKLEEKLVADHETISKTNDDNILITRCPQVELALIKQYVENLAAIATNGDFAEAVEIISTVQSSAKAKNTSGKVITLNPQARNS